MDSWSDRRREPRTPSDGPVTLHALAPVRQTFVGTLVDQSLSGMRVRHEGRMLETGELVEFETQLRKGRARVMWTRFGGEEGYEAGLYILTAA